MEAGSYDLAPGEAFESRLLLAKAYANLQAADLMRWKAANLFDAFYRHLGQGESIGQALRAAQDERIRAGAPPAAWAGLVVLGDGDFVPLPGGKAAASLSDKLWLTLVGGVVLALLLLPWTRRRS